MTLLTGLAVSPEGNVESSLLAEYELKQSKITMGVDSNLDVKTSIETMLAPGVQMQLCADIGHLKGHYRFGYGIVMG